MELVLGHQELTSTGGSESYLLTVGEQLQRLGHEVTIYTVEAGEMAEVARTRGLRVVTAEHELPGECDGVVSQDGVVAPILAAHYPATPQIFVAHAPGHSVQRPPQLDGVVSAVVVLNDRVRRRMEGLAKQHKLVRLQQPIDVRRFIPRRDLRQKPERLLLLSNYVGGSAREMLGAACSAAGVEFEHVGGGRQSTSPERQIAASDITVGQGRAAIEGMAAGRAVYVLSHGGGEGWVTPQSYPALEANGFAGISSDGTIDADRLRRDLAAYRPEMGLVNRQLAFAHHHAMDHACELVWLFDRESPPRPRPDAPLREMARLVRLQWQTESSFSQLAGENKWLREELDRERERNRRADDQLAAATRSADEEIAAFRRTRRYRMASLLARPLDEWRRRRR